MKTLFITLLFTAISMAGFSQVENNDAYYVPEGFGKKIPEKITIKFDISENEAFTRAIKILVADEYTFSTIDEKYKYAISTPRNIKYATVEITLKADNHYLIISGKFKTADSPDWNTIKNKGMKGSPSRNAWNELERISELLK